MGRVTVRDALTNSLNVATVKVAELIGYGRVVQVARQMGLGTNIEPTPAVALGAYEMTPIDVAAGYTTFANIGTRAEPQFLRSVIGADGTQLEKFTPQTHMALDPRVAFLVDSLLKDVLNRGTGAGVRARGFTLPAAGQDRYLARRLVRGIHFESALRDLDRLRRQPRPGASGRRGGRADLGGLHDARHVARRVPRREGFHDAGRRAVRGDRPGIAAARHRQLSDDARRSLRRRFGADAILRTPRRAQPAFFDGIVSFPRFWGPAKDAAGRWNRAASCPLRP